MHSPRPHRALLSAHRAAAAETGVDENSWEALHAAVRMPVEFVEFDVHRSADNELFLAHDSHLSVCGIRRRVETLTVRQIEQATGHAVVRYEDALRLLSKHGKKAHIDFKFLSAAHRYMRPETTLEVVAAQRALDVMGAPDRFIITTMNDVSIDVVSAWAEAHSPGVLVGLSVAASVFPGRRLANTRASLLVAHWAIANARLLTWANKRDIPVLVWTVDAPRILNRLATDPRVWMVTTNHPSRLLSA